MVKTERRPGKEPVVTTTKKSKELTDAWYEKGTLDVAGAVGVGAVASVLKVHVDAYEQSISITPLAQYTAGGAGLIGVPYLLDFREIKFKRGTTGEKDFWDIELRGGKELGPVGKVPLARLLSVDLEAGWGMLQNGIDGKVTLLARPGERVCISISGKLGRDDIRKSFYGGAAGVRFPIYGPFEGELSGFVTQFPSPKSKNPYLEAGGWANLVVRF